MDFPGSATTNIHFIDGFSTIYWRIYTEEQGISNNPQDGPANGYTILRHLGRLKDLEARLRGLNCLASCPRRLGLWVFSSTPNFESLASLYVKEGETETTKILVDTTTLKVSASGSAASQELIKSLSAESQNNAGTQSSGQQRPQQAQSSSRRPDGYSSLAAIYTSFISAVTGAISLHLIRSRGALPLGSRTLFTAVEKLGYESPRIDNESVLSQSCLTTLNVQLNASGSLTISPQTISQPGITRLCSLRDDIADLLRVQPGTDIWLCPNGAIARLVTANVESPAIPSPEYPSSVNNFAKQQQWKLDVVQWLANFGLQTDSIDEEPWVEVEVWEPFFARLAGETWRQSEDTQSALPLKRMLWPARFCFRRTGQMVRPSGLPHTSNDPLEFAEHWFSEASSLKLNQEPPTNFSVPEEAQLKDQDMASPQVDSTENLESLSRMAQYPDLQSTNLVYPTPPDGAAIVGVNNPNASEMSPDEPDFNTLSNTGQDVKNTSDAVFSPDIQVGTGRYDASDDEDLFGDMHDKDFGSKGITDADFSFFDDPTLDAMDEDVPDQKPTVETPQAPANEEVVDNEEAKKDPDENPPGNDVLEAPQAPETAETEEPTFKREDFQKSPVDESMGLDESMPSPQEPKSQTISPPLSPVEIKKILFPGSEAEDITSQPSDSRFQQGHYHPIAFERKIGDWDQKYGAAGKFWFSTGNTGEKSELNSNSIPTIGMPHRGRSGASTRSIDQGAAALPSSENHTRSSSTSSSASSDLSDDTPPANASTPMAMIIPSLKRKRVPSESDIQSAASPAKASSVPETGAVTKGDNTTFLGNFLANFSDWTFIGYFSATQIQQVPVLVRREDQVQIAQLLVDQITQSSFDHQLSGRASLCSLNDENVPLQALLEDVNFLGNITKVDLKGYTTLQEDPTPSKEPSRGAISRSFAPHLRVRRGKDFLEALPTSVAFWETFGLEPAHGVKNISAYCIHPQATSKAADVFLDRFGLLYQSCNFGTHTRGDPLSTFANGLAAWDSENSSYSSMMQSLNQLCEKLGTELAQAPSDTDNCVVYIVNPFPHAAALFDICAAFWRLFQQLAANGDRQQARQINDVVLQIIPLEFIFSEDSMVVPTQTEYLNLALEVYSRCRSKDADPSPFVSAPAIVLADPSPKTIGFRLAPEKGSPLQDGRSLHLALSKSSDSRWMSAAWTDGTGSVQMTMSYCLRYRSRGVARPVAEVRNEIWSTTKHIMDNYQARWRLILVNTEPMDPEDMEAWTNLSDQHNKARNGTLELTIVTVSAIPDMILEPPVSAMTTGVLNPPFSSTPVSTPNPSISIASPEQVGNAPTPGAPYNAPTPTEPSMEPDSDVVLTDICDESWAVTLSHRLNNSHHATDFRPALVSGYLLRRKGAFDGDGCFSMTVNLVHAPRPPPTHVAVLKDILGMYRDLATLARARGIRSVQNNTLPWHIATALRAQELLSYVL